MSSVANVWHRTVASSSSSTIDFMIELAGVIVTCLRIEMITCN